ncbi:MAG: membrane-anchored protein YejM (alkaline phosphatase superfamily) [Planctomycetota bacterium]|jgi:membrane-anchored protein YejM (alkaline phosphatase superfamily)
MEANLEGHKRGKLQRLGPLGRALSRHISQPGRGCFLGATVRFWIWNVVAAALLHYRYTDNVNTSESIKAWSFLHLALVSNSFGLTFPFALLSTLLAMVWPRNAKHSLTTIFALIWGLFLVAILVDTEIWGTFRYHFNGMVWATIKNPAAGDAIHFSTSDYVLSSLEIGFIFLAEWWLFRWLLKRAPGGFRPPSKRILLLILLPIFLVEKVIYAHADLYRDRRVTALARVFPLYQRLTIKRTMRKHFGFVLEDRPKVDLSGGGILLDYPLSRPVFAEASGQRPNIVVIAIDSVREDMLASATMPHLQAYVDDTANGALVFKDHYSGGNATRFGLFSMIYGLHGSYWIPVYTESTPPVLVDSLMELDYEMQVLSTASMDYPELRSTAWVRMEEHVNDDLEGDTPGERDASMAIAFEDWLTELEAEGKDDKPLFTFAVLDAPHQTYSFPDPPEGAPFFEPYMETVNYRGLAKNATDEQKVLIKNRYKNSVLHADRVVHDMVESLRAHGEWENTILIITADHGEEFWENGFWGHTSNFTKEQAHVPFVLSGPGVTGGVETRATSHVDLAATLLELIGADPANRAEWTVGFNLLDLPADQAMVNDHSQPEGYRRRTISGWDLLGIDAPGGILVVPTETHRGLVEPWTHNWQPMMDDNLIKDEAQALSRTALECRRFLR